MLRVIREVKPQWVVGENVRGLLNWNGGMVFHEVCADLENIGYEVQAFIIPASGINAPHQRERLWIVAHSINCGYSARREQDAEENRLQKQYRSEMDCREFNRTSVSSISTNSNLHGFHKRNGNNEINASKRGLNALNDIDQISINTERIGRIKKWDDNGQFKETQQEKCGELKFSRTDSTQDKWRNFPTQSPVCSGDDGISYGLDNITFPKWRNESIKGYGNAVVPQVVYRIFKTIEYIQNLNDNTQSKN
jgi:DNA (cytosine-5)-methyltransferase 1